jgi:hypothetical protein
MAKRYSVSHLICTGPATSAITLRPRIGVRSTSETSTSVEPHRFHSRLEARRSFSRSARTAAPTYSIKTTMGALAAVWQPKSSRNNHSARRPRSIRWQASRMSRCRAPAFPARRLHPNTSLKIGVGIRPTITQAWCGKVSGAGSPIVTTTDGTSDPVVWTVGAEGDNRLHGFKGDTGEPLFSGGAGPSMVGLHHFQTLIATKDRLYVGADGRIYAFAF